MNWKEVLKKDFARRRKIEKYNKCFRVWKQRTPTRKEKEDDDE